MLLRSIALLLLGLTLSGCLTAGLWEPYEEDPYFFDSSPDPDEPAEYTVDESRYLFGRRWIDITIRVILTPVALFLDLGYILGTHFPGAF